MSNDTVVPAEDTKVTAPEEKQENKTIGDILDKKEEAREEKVVPESVFLKEKSARKELTKEVKELRKMIENGDTKQEVSQTIEEIAEEFNVDKNFVSKLAKAIKGDTEKDLEERVASKLKPIEEREKGEKITKIFNEHFEKVIDELPEYKDIVNKDVIKKLSLDPENSNKTFQQLIEETYGRSIRGKKTLESTTPRGGKEPEEIDYTRAAKDSAYYKEIMSNPTLKKEYNGNLMSRIAKYL